MWTLSKDGDSFKGIWINDGESGNQTKDWSGTRIKKL
jgi:hypothetical protein